ncbi:hypothetical protein WDU94_001852 [Cyamophila willieti]
MLHFKRKTVYCALLCCLLVKECLPSHQSRPSPMFAMSDLTNDFGVCALQPRSREVYNKRGHPLAVVYNDQGEVTVAKFDQFDRLLYQVFDTNGGMIFDRKGKPIHGIYNFQDQPRQVVYDRQHREVYPEFDEENRPTRYLYDKDGHPMYDGEGRPWPDVATNEAPPPSETKRKRKRKGGVGNFMQEVRKLTEEVEMLKKHINGDNGIITEEKNVDELKKELRADIEAELEKETDSREELEKILREDLERHLGLLSEQDHEESKASTSEKSEESEEVVCDKTPKNLSDIDRSLDSLECVVAKIFNAIQNKVSDRGQFEGNLTLALILVCHLLNKLFENSKLLLDENEQTALELQFQYELIENLELKKTMSRDEQEEKYAELETKLESIAKIQREIQRRKVDQDTALYIINEHKTHMEKLNDAMQEKIEACKEEEKKIHKDIKEVRDGVEGFVDNLTYLIEEIKTKESRETFQAFTKCMLDCLKKVEDYVNKWMTKPVFVSGGREPDLTKTNCLCCGQEGIMSRNAEKPMFPVLSVMNSKSCQRFQKKLDLRGEYCLKGNFDKSKFCPDLKFPELGDLY